jgi:hypothetical protein
MLLTFGLAGVGAYLVWWLTQRAPALLDRLFTRIDEQQARQIKHDEEQTDRVTGKLEEVKAEVSALREQMVRHGCINGKGTGSPSLN